MVTQQTVPMQLIHCWEYIKMDAVTMYWLTSIYIRTSSQLLCLDMSMVIAMTSTERNQKCANTLRIKETMQYLTIDTTSSMYISTSIEMMVTMIPTSNRVITPCIFPTKWAIMSYFLQAKV